MDTLYPELKDYIYEYCGKFMTEEEHMARRTILYGLKTQSETRRSIMLEQKLISNDPNILRLVEDGHEALKERIVHRIWNKHRSELTLNLCPVCGKITRTPDARQCRFCFHDWH
jgi:hypothetical protein